MEPLSTAQSEIFASVDSQPLEFSEGIAVSADWLKQDPRQAAERSEPRSFAAMLRDVVLEEPIGHWTPATGAVYAP